MLDWMRSPAIAGEWKALWISAPLWISAGSLKLLYFIVWHCILAQFYELYKNTMPDSETEQFKAAGGDPYWGGDP